MSIPPDNYQILGISPQCTSEQLKQAYKNLAKIYHPDKLKSDSSKTVDTGMDFVKISNAYQSVTTDIQNRNRRERLRKKYDQYMEKIIDILQPEESAESVSEEGSSEKIQELGSYYFQRQQQRMNEAYEKFSSLFSKSEKQSEQTQSDSGAASRAGRTLVEWSAEEVQELIHSRKPIFTIVHIKRL